MSEKHPSRLDSPQSASKLTTTRLDIATNHATIAPAHAAIPAATLRPAPANWRGCGYRRRWTARRGGAADQPRPLR